MRILLSASDYTNLTNGLARSARDFCQGLRERGHELKVLSYGEESSVEYPLPELRIPILNAYIHAQHFRIARPDLRAIKAALQWADIVYVEDPLPANAVLVREARRARISVPGIEPSEHQSRFVFFVLLVGLFSLRLHSCANSGGQGTFRALWVQGSN